MAESRKLRVFLCHASQDKPIVRELYQRLLAEDWLDPWLDEEKLLPGQDWGMEIEKAVESADVVLVCISSRSVTKEGYIQREIKFALDIALEKPEGTIFVIPLRLDDCEIPRRLRSWQYVDYFPIEQREINLQKLFQALKVRYGQMGRDSYEAHVELPTPINSVQMSSKAAKKRVEYKTVPSNNKVDIGGIALQIFFYVLAAIYAFGESSDDFMLPLGISAILSAAYFLYRKRFFYDQPIKIVTLLFLVTYGVLIYSQYASWRADDLFGTIAGIASLATAGLMMAKIRFEQKSIPYFSIAFALFSLLFGVKIILNAFGGYPSELSYPIVVSGIAAAILLWFEL